jgi:hypothetical protein
MDLFIFDFTSFNTYCKSELTIAIVYFVSKLLKLDELKNLVAKEKNSMNSETFKQCFMAVVTLFKKSQANSNFVSI